MTPGVIFLSGHPPRLLVFAESLFCDRKPADVRGPFFKSLLKVLSQRLGRRQLSVWWNHRVLFFMFKIWLFLKTLCERTKNCVNFPQNRQNNNQYSRPTSCEQPEESGTGRAPLNVAQTWGGKKNKIQILHKMQRWLFFWWQTLVSVCDRGPAGVCERENKKRTQQFVVSLSCAFRPDPGWNKDRKLLHAVPFSVGGASSSDRRNLRPQCV